MINSSITTLLSISAISLLAACATAPAPTPISTTKLTEAKSLIRSSNLRQPDTTHINQVDQRTIKVKDKLVWPIRKVCLVSGDASKRKCEKGFIYRIIEDDYFNAFAHGSNNITLHSGLIRRTISDDELAFVIAHEAGHHIANHLFETKYNSFLGQITGGVLMGALTAGILAGLGVECEYGEDCSWVEETIGESVEDGMEMGREFAVARYTREQELEADKIATSILMESEYSARKVAPLLTYMGKLDEKKTFSEFGDSHPSGPERLGVFLQRLPYEPSYKSSTHSPNTVNQSSKSTTSNTSARELGSKYTELRNLGVTVSSEITEYGTSFKGFTIITTSSSLNGFNLERGDIIWRYNTCDGSHDYLSDRQSLQTLEKTPAVEIKTIIVRRGEGFEDLRRSNYSTDCSATTSPELQPTTQAKKVKSADFKIGFEASKKGDFKTALAVWRPLAEQGDAHAQNYLGHMYSGGVGILQDHKESVKWYKLAAEQGLADAQSYLGRAYDNGRGVRHDRQEALKWYRLAAEQGRTDAQNYLGEAYDYGRGVLQNYKEAVKWYRRAAEQGYADAHYNLGVSYANGRGVPYDNVYAYMWYNVASVNGIKEGAANRDKKSKHMTPSQIEKAQELARQCIKKEYKDC